MIPVLARSKPNDESEFRQLEQLFDEFRISYHWHKVLSVLGFWKVARNHSF